MIFFQWNLMLRKVEPKNWSKTIHNLLGMFMTDKLAMAYSLKGLSVIQFPIAGVWTQIISKLFILINCNFVKPNQ